MGKTVKPDIISLPITANELAAAKEYARRVRESAGVSTASRASKRNFAVAANEEMNMRLELALADAELAAGNNVEEWTQRRATARTRLSKALREQGQLAEAYTYADTEAEKASLRHGYEALYSRDDDDFTCTAGCSDIQDGRIIPRWYRVKHDIPRLGSGAAPEFVALWRCQQCGCLNGSPKTPPGVAKLERLRAAAGPNPTEPMHDSEVFANATE